jgi:DNA polymerase V
MPLALIDCNNFYVSCERLFNPKLEGKPVVVLSNNDGCAVSRSNEVKALGIKMAEPWFKMEKLARKHGIVAYSSNYTLYGDISARVMATLANFSPRQEVYSIDECFLDLDGFPLDTLEDYGQTIRRTVKRNIGIPVCVGIAQTKTLAKLANHCAKKGLAGSEGVCDFGRLSEAQRRTLFESLPVGEIWGVGRRIAEKLHSLGILTVEALRTSDPKLIRRHCSVVLERTVQELNGVPCIELEQAVARQQIIVSRSFGHPVASLDDLKESVSHFTTRAAEKLRKDGSVASSICVHIRTNPFKEREPQYDTSLVVPLRQPTDDTSALVNAAMCGLTEIYRPGFQYKKSGVLLLGLHPKGIQQACLFEDTQQDARASQRMQVIDAINQKMGRDTITLAASDIQKRWAMRRDKVSPNYTTSWDEIPRVSG